MSAGPSIEPERVSDPSRAEPHADVAVRAVGAVMDGIIAFDAAGIVVLMNPAAERMLGLRSFTTLGRGIAGIPDGGELVAALGRELARADSDRESSRVVEVHRADAPDLVYVRVSVRSMRDGHGAVAGQVARLEDVSSEHKSDQLKNQYLSIVAHELRTPLTGIKTFSTMMAKGTLGPLTDRQAAVVESIREQSLRLEHQIDKLVNLGHIDSSEYGQDLERFDLADLARQSAAPFEKVATDRSIAFALMLPEDGPRLVDGDRSDLKRAMQALIENAIKFTRDGGRVDVTLRDVDGGRVEFAIRDDGAGIERRYHARIFEKFFQVEDPLTRHHGGSGLGLFFVKSIVEAHGSRVRVDSELGAGSRFAFDVARAPAGGEADTATPPTTPDTGND